MNRRDAETRSEELELSFDALILSLRLSVSAVSIFGP